MSGIKAGSFILMVALLFYATQTYGATVSKVTGTWSNTVPEANPTIEENIEGLNGFNDMRYGTPPNDATEQSGLGFKGEDTPFKVTPGKPFPIAVLQHYNYPILPTSTVSGVDIDIQLTFFNPLGLDATFQLTLGITETLNEPDPEEGVPDIISLPSGQAKEPIKIGNTMYTVELLGFGDRADELLDEIQSSEGKTNQTTVWARLTADQLPTPVLLPGATLLLWGK